MSVTQFDLESATRAHRLAGGAVGSRWSSSGERVLGPCVWPRRRLILVIGLTSVLVAGRLRDVVAQDVSCELSPVPGPYGYQRRGDRCEGLFQQQVGGTTLRLVSLTESFEALGDTTRAPLLVAWSVPGNGDVWLRAQGIRKKLYYRMDSRRPGGAGLYHWPSDVLAAQRIKRDHIGILGWTRYALGGIDQDVYVPLRVTQESATVQCGTYLLVLVPGVKLDEVYVSLGRLGAPGQPVQWLRHNKPLLYGFYPADTPIRVPVPELAAPGFYELEISAELASGGPTGIPSRRIYQAGGLPACGGWSR